MEVTSFSNWIRRLALVLALAPSASVLTLGQESTANAGLADSVRALNQRLAGPLPSNPAALLSNLVERAGRLSALMESDARAAISLALPAEEAARLSSILPDAVNQIESRGEWKGPLTVVVEDDFARGASRTRFWIETGGERVEVHFEDTPAFLTSGEIIEVWGIRLGNRIAAALSSVAPAASGASLCGPTGELKIAILIIQFPGVPFSSDVVTPAELHDIYFSNTKMSADGYWREVSYGQTFATGDVFGPFTLDKNYDFSTQQFEGLQAAINAADATVDFTIYNHVVVIWPLPGVSGWGGRGGVGCLTLNSPSKGSFAGTEAIMGVGTRQPYQGMVGIAAHEGGHNLGLNHASSLDYVPLVLGLPGADGVHQEYGDRFSVMGGGEGGLALGHYNAPHKNKLGWLDPSSILPVETGGSFVVSPIENTTGPRALRIRRAPGVNQWLWVEYRQPIGHDATLTTAGIQPFSGALIHLEDPAQEPNHTFLLDFTPNTPHDFSDPALSAGQVWSDTYSPLSIRVDSASPTGLGVSVSYRTPCTTLNPASRSHGPGAETGTFAIAAAATCSWTATSSADWITVIAGASGSGNGTVNYAVTANGTRSARTGSIFVGFQAFTITQATSFVSQPASVDSVSPSGGSGLSQTFTFSVSDPNGAADLRNMDVDFVKSGGDRFICQFGYTMASKQIYMLTDDLHNLIGPVTAGSNVALQNSQCGVDVSHVTATSSGNTMQLAFPVVLLTPGTWSIQVNLYTLEKMDTFKIIGTWNTQKSCSYSFAPAGAAVERNSTAGTIAVAADPGCPWLASANSPWISITSAVSGAGGGSVSYAIAANTSPAPRSGTLTIAGRTFSVTQSVNAATRPVIAPNGVVSGASFRPGLAASSWISIAGTGLAPAERSWGASDFPGNRLPTQIGGVSVSINGKPAYVYYVSPGQLNVLAPDDDFVGLVQVEVDAPQGRSDPVTIQKQQFLPALFLFNQGGHKYAAAVHQDGVYVGATDLIPGATRPAVPGEIISLFGSGFGPTNPANSAAVVVAQPAPLSAPVTVRIGNVVADVAFAGLSGSGLYQFNVTVPDLPAGDQAVAIEIGGATSQGNAFITVGR